MIKENYLKEKLKKNKLVFGTWNTVPSVALADIIASSGLDFVFIDFEHGPISIEKAQEMIIAYESRLVSPLVRVSGLDEMQILRTLDIGAHGIQVPNISKENDIKKIVNYAKFPPIGSRGLSPFTRSNNYNQINSIEYTKIANENTLIGINIESIEAANNINKLLDINEIDLYFIGLFDLSKSLGIPGLIDDNKVTEILKNIIKTVKNKNKYVGTIATNEKQIDRLIDLGVSFIVYSVDTFVIKEAYSDILK